MLFKIYGRNIFKNGFSVVRNLISSKESKKFRLEINKVFQLPKTKFPKVN